VNRTVLFVCPHGAAKSRLAAALFNRLAPHGWHATSAGLQPQEQTSARTVELVIGADLETLLDRQPPRPMPDEPAMAMAISIDCDLPGADRWDLAHQRIGAAMLDELRQRVEALAPQVASAER
jgi:arsenate reductase (thioredoxin)